MTSFIYSKDCAKKSLPLFAFLPQTLVLRRAEAKMINGRVGGWAESSVTGQPGEESRHTQNARPVFCRVLRVYVLCTDHSRPFAAVHKSLSSIPQLNSVHPLRRSLPSHSSRLFVLLPHIPSLHTGSGGGRARGDLCRWIKSLMPLTKPARVPRRGGGFSISNACLAARSESSTILCARTCTVQYVPCLREHARFFRLVWTEGGPDVMSVSGTYRGCPMFMHACA